MGQPSTGRRHLPRVVSWLLPRLGDSLQTGLSPTSCPLQGKGTDQLIEGACSLCCCSLAPLVQRVLPVDSRGQSDSCPSYAEQHRECLLGPQEEKQQGQQNDHHFIQHSNNFFFFFCGPFQDSVTETCASYSQEHAMAKVVAYRHLPASMEPKHDPPAPPPTSRGFPPLQAHV